MTLLFRFRSADLLRCRFAVSPLTETCSALRALTMPGAAAYHLPWQRRARPLVPGLGIEALLAVLSWRGEQPDFLDPAPGTPFTEIDAELSRVRATPPARVAAELAPLRQAHPALAGDPAAVCDQLADMLARAWSALIEPWWPRLRDVLDADITYRARRLADAGTTATLNDLDARISWDGHALRFAGRHDGAAAVTRDIDASGADIVLVPSVFIWPGAAVSFDPPAVIYPARGIGQLWQPGARSADDLARLIGRTRAALLSALAEPASTTGLAARAGVPVSSVSEHLAVLRAAGLVTTTRTGRFLVHQRTALGIALAG
jgi:DNA-binding transcriptional ArsR family regulator